MSIDIKVTKLGQKEMKGYQQSQLTLRFSGKSCNSTVVNTLRRAVLDYIPTYSFHPSMIDITSNTSIFDNDIMRLRLSQIVIPNINNKIDVLTDEYWKNVDFTDKDRLKHPKDVDTYDLYISKVNKSDVNINVTLNDSVFIKNDNEEESPFDSKHPPLVVQLRHGEEFSCKMRAVLGVGKLNGIFSGAGTSYYSEEKDGYVLVVESAGQCTESELLKKACVVVKSKMEEVKSVVKTVYTDTENQNKILIKLPNYDMTTGNIINEFLQDHKKVKFSGVTKPDMNVEEVQILLVTEDSKPLAPFFDTVDYVSKLFSKIQEQL